MPLNYQHPFTPKHLLLPKFIVRLLFILIACTLPQDAFSQEKDLAGAMAAHLACYPIELLDFYRQKPLIETKDFCLASIYHETGPEPLWVSSDGPGTQADIILAYLKAADLEGLDAGDYEITEMERLWRSKKTDDLARLDTMITYNLVKYIHDMRHGQMKFHASDPALFAEAGNERFNPLQAVQAARSAPNLNSYLGALAPHHHYYVSLKKALSHYKNLAQKGGWKFIENGPLIKPGMRDSRLEAIRSRLTIDQGLQVAPEDTGIYDEDLVNAIMLFQKKNGLETDGIIGPQTLAELNVSPEDRINTIRVNMARWRWHAHDLGEDYVMVNIAGFVLRAVRHNTTVLEMPVIVGQRQHQTPVFSDAIKYLDFHPFWNVTASIARNEELPELRLNPSHLVERNIRLFSGWQPDAVELDSTTIDWHTVSRSQMSRYRLRQDPGPWNALGRVKFVFPNHYSVYLHDTPARDLFEHSFRSFSHGCIRVSRPLALALYVLQTQDSSWDAAKIDAIIAAEKRRIIRLNSPLPIHITYQTAWVDDLGAVHFSRDIYKRDAKLQKVLLNQQPNQ